MEPNLRPQIKLIKLVFHYLTYEERTVDQLSPTTQEFNQSKPYYFVANEISFICFFGEHSY